MSTHPSHRPRYAVAFYRTDKRPRVFHFRSWDVALDAADRFADRLHAVAMIHEMPVKPLAR